MKNFNDFLPKQPNKTEQTVNILIQQIVETQKVCMGLQRQIAGLCLYLGLKSEQVANNNFNEGIDGFLKEVQDAEILIVNAKNKERDEKIKEMNNN